MTEGFEKIIDLTKTDDDILAVILFGSRAKNENLPSSDVDICLVLRLKRYLPVFLSQKKLQYLEKFPYYDIQLYQQLPIYIRKRILKEGKILFCQDEDEMYTLAFRTIDEFEHFRRFYQEYLAEVERG